MHSLLAQFTAGGKLVFRSLNRRRPVNIVGNNNSNNVEVTQSKSKVIEIGAMPKCDIVGLTSRVDKPLDFLGLYKCVYEPNHRAHIPAKQVCF